MRRILTVLLLLTVVFLSVEQIEKPKRIRSYVTYIDIYAHHPGQINHYRLTNDREMTWILSHLRAMNQKPATNDFPVRDPRNNYTILVHLSDGRYHLYEQWGDRFFKKDTEQWKAIDPDHGKYLILYEGQFHTAFYFSKNTPNIFDKTTNDIPPAFV